MTSGLTRFTRIDDANLLRDIANPVTEVFTDTDWAEMEALRTATAGRLERESGLLPGDVRHRAFYRSAFATEGLKAFADAIPPEEELEQDQIYDGEDRVFDSTLRRQAQLTVLAFKTGVAVSADLWLGGFDTHAYHDPDHEWLLGNLTDGVDYLWEYAEEHGIAGSHGRRDGLGLRADELLQLRRGQGPLAHRQLHRHGEEPALDGPRGGRDGRAALRSAHQPSHASPRRAGRDHHLPEARAQGASPVLRHRRHPGGAAFPFQQHRRLRVLRLSERISFSEDKAQPTNRAPQPIAAVAIKTLGPIGSPRGAALSALRSR